MNAHRLTRIRHLFNEALKKSPEERDDFLRRACPEDPEVRDEVRRMLQSDESETHGFLRSPLEDVLEPSSPSIPSVEIREVMGRGGMGTVYRGFQPILQRDVAVKVIARGGPEQVASEERFLREARAVAKLKHPGVAPIYEIGETDHVRYMIMDLIEGHDLGHEISLQRRWAQEEESGEPPALPGYGTSAYQTSVAQTIAKTAFALEYAHQHGIVHRDVKPENIVLDLESQDSEIAPKVVDFGIAKNEHLGTITQADGLIGTFFYMSPEQARATRSKIGPRTDIYSLGVVLYELLTLERPFDGSPAKVLTKIASRQEPRPPRLLAPQVPQDLDLIVRTAIAKNPEDRYERALDFAEDLDAFANKQPLVHARPPRLATRGWRFLRRHREIVGLATAILITAIAAFILGSRSETKTGFVSITTDRPGADVIAYSFDDHALSQGIELGQTPLQSAPLDVGYFVIHIIEDQNHYAELIAHIQEPHQPLAFENVPLRPLADVTQDMVRISGSSDNGLAAFYLDDAEVSNREYREFLLATGGQAPPFWPSQWAGDWNETWDSLPVAYVSYEDATSYAQWAGKRLPTQEEWIRAAAGPQGNAFPWGPDRAPWQKDKSYKQSMFANLDWDQTRPRSSELQSQDGTPLFDREWDLYLNRIRANHHHDRGQSAEGAFEMAGNVSEWVRGPFVTDENQLLIGCAPLLGRSWAESQLKDLDVVESPPMQAMGPHIGFRCAKTLIDTREGG